MADRTPPSSTYRIQLHAGFGFNDTAEVVPYLSRLGVSSLYLSPILQAAPGSMHGYDVVDHATVSADLGGEAALADLADTAHEHGLGIVVDVVPNHMAIPSPEHLNPQLWDTLRRGPDGAVAHWFDVDWAAGDGRLGLPILGGPADDLLSAGELTVDEIRRDGQPPEPVLRYGDHVFPLADGSDTADVASLLHQQHYLLADWHDKGSVLNYRRFFDVDTLIAIRVELDDVFDATHGVLLDLHRRGVVDGFRVDHPDGLADPQGYLERLRDVTGGAWVVVEKILEADEALPQSWPCAGTTGYDSIRAIEGALVPAAAGPLGRRWQSTGGEPSYPAVEQAAKRLVISDLFPPEVARLATAAVSAAAATGERLDRDAALAGLSELLAHVEVYRAYLRLDCEPDAHALERLDALVGAATNSRPDLAAPIAVLRRLLADTRTDSPAGRDLVVRFQQVCGPVMAKGVEDTTFYRWHRLIALNEVGGDPLSMDAASSESLHAWARRQAARYPDGLTTLSTHDTKRNEDVRARLLAGAENLTGWDAAWSAVQRAAAEADVDEPTAYLLMQTLMGSWPIDAGRLGDYMLKAVREAKQHTAWNEPDEAYEERVRRLVADCLTGPVAGEIAGVVRANAATVRATTLAAKLVQLTVPGVPDTYQGDELVSPALVDPDNRRPVDYAHAERLLSRLDAGHALPGDGFADDLSAEKLWVTSRVLRLRRDRRDLVDASAGYQSLACESPHLLGFLRGDRLATLVTRWPGLLAGSGGWGSTVVLLPAGRWRDVLTAAVHEIGPAGARLADVFRDLPVALLLKEDA